MSGTYKVKVEHLTKYFGDLMCLRFPFNIRKGEFLCVVRSTVERQRFNLLTRSNAPGESGTSIGNRRPEAAHLSVVFRNPRDAMAYVERICASV